MYGVLYYAPFTEVAVSATQDVFEIASPSDACVAIHSICWGQSSDAGDAQAELLDIVMTLVTGAPTSGSGGSTVTVEAKNQNSSAAAGSTVEANNTTQISGGTSNVVYAGAWNVQLPFEYIPPPEQRIIMPPSEHFTIALPNAPTDAITLSGVIIFEEIG